MYFNWPPIVLRGEQSQQPQGYAFSDDDCVSDTEKVENFIVRIFVNKSQNEYGKCKVFYASK